MKFKLSWLLTLFLAFSVSFTFAQEKTITGTVTSAKDGLPLPGVNVLVKGTVRGAQTDFDGRYSLQASTGEVLEFSFLGQKTIEMTIGSSSVINISMEEDTQALDEVVIIGFGERTKDKLLQSVAVVDNESFKDSPVSSAQDILQGQASGVQVVNSSGVLGSAPVVKIRGVGSITSGGRPLFVVDGIPLNDASITTAQGGQALNPLADINPNDIESVSVLKDAAATAIYGSRGSNGVVLITTKGGKLNQKTTVTLNVTTSVSESTDEFDMLDADQYRQFLVDRGSAPNVGVLPQGSFDWPEAVTRTGYSKNIDFSVTGGGEKTTYYVGFTHADQDGFIIGNELTRFTGRLNLTHQANDWLKVGMNLGISENKFDRVGTENNTFAPLTSAYLQLPWVEPFDANGNFVNTGFIANVLAIEALHANDSDTYRTTGNVFGEISFLEDFTFRSTFGIDRVLLEEFQRQVEVNAPNGFAFDYVAQQNKFVLNNVLNYSKSFADVHNIGVDVGFSYEQTDVRQIQVDATGFLSDKQINTVSGSEPGTTLNQTNGNRLVGYFARANYDYDGKYLVEGSIRRDGSSRFGPENKFGTFWSVSGGWILSEEEFLKNSEWINFLKIKGGFGTTGNDRIGDFDFLARFEGGNTSNYNGASGLRQLSAANPNLKWEASESFDIGIEAELFNRRVNFGVEYYKRTITDLILDQPIPQTNGGLNVITQNIGEMENSGFDVSLRTVNIRTDDFEWSTTINLGINDNEVISLPGASVDPEGRRFINGSASQRAIEGESVNTFYLIRYKGINPDTGDAEWFAKDGTTTTAPTAADRVIVGDANPDFQGGFTNTFKYKNWDLNVFFNYSVGNDIMIDGLRFSDNVAGGFNLRTDILNYWRNPGDQAFAPSLSSPTFGRYAQRSTLQLRDGSFARLKNLTLGYNLPSQFVERSGFISSARLYFTANNLLTIKGSDLDGIDPEVTSTVGNLGQGETFFTAPQSKTYLLGVRLTF